MAEPLKKLVVVGASARACTASALRAGYQVVAADLFADADLQRACAATRITGYPEALADWLAAAECDGWLYTGALENHPELISRMAKLRPLLGNGGAVLRAVRNPLILEPVLRDAGLSFPETIDSAKRLPLDSSWLCKTYRGAGGSGVWLLNSPEALQRAEREQAVYQRFVGGVSAAAVFVCSSDGGQLFGVTRQLVGDARAGAKPWHYAGSLGPLPVGKEVDSQLAKLGDLLSRRFQLRGLVGVDLVIANNRAWVLEINPRYSASVEVIERITGRSAIAEHVAACGGAVRSESRSATARTADGSNALAYGKAVLFAKHDVTITPAFYQWAIAQASVELEQCRLADIPEAGQRLSIGQPVLTVFASRSAQELDAEFGLRIADVESRLYGGK
ncbi:MAG: ATP-grasp domain-containing protein [Pirellulales bacterium]|nr:ATP-grasp domain-containing protein [Pirellulales bacterium]